MTFARLLFLLLLLAGTTTLSMAADSDDAAKSQTSVGSLQNQVGDAIPFGTPAQDLGSSSGLFFLKTRPQLGLNPLILQPTFAIVNDDLCYTMRTYKVKRKEHFADGESGSRGYSTCEMATNYQVRSAVAHERLADDSRNSASQINEPQK
jgi:hypothetical protein